MFTINLHYNNLWFTVNNYINKFQKKPIKKIKYTLKTNFKLLINLIKSKII